jgi:PAS domain S-box-containing protein
MNQDEKAENIWVNMLLKEQLILKERALSATAEGITISDNLLPDNPIIYANKGFERLTGYAIADVMGKNCRFLQGAGTDADVVAEIRSAVAEGRECTVEILNYRQDGTPFWNRLSITPVKDAEGKVTNFIGIQSDITKRKNAEDALVKTTKQLELANRRMKNDLDEARKIQLAMLPDTVPKLPYMDIAVSMNTAQEVGGDYYDFHVENNESLTVAIGDATGHGLKAGTMVTATKVLFNSLAHHEDPVYILNKTSAALKGMGFGHMYMAMIIAKITRKKLLLSAAGMPFTYFYHACKDEVSEIALKGMPLGSFPDFPYQFQEISLTKGDTILFLSDGFLELRNEHGDFFGEERTKALYHRSAEQTSAKIIASLHDAASEWLGEGVINDDMTLMVLKVK